MVTGAVGTEGKSAALGVNVASGLGYNTSAWALSWLQRLWDGPLAKVGHQAHEAAVTPLDR